MRSRRAESKAVSGKVREKRLYRPGIQGLEQRIALSIDLVDIAGPPPDGPYGVLEIGSNTASGTGWSVAELGDVNGDGFQDWLIGAPTINIGTAFPTVGAGTTSSAYLIFGSAEVSGGNVDWANELLFQFDDRIGQLNELGNAIQSNPVTGAAGFQYNGLRFFSSQPNAQVGSSVASAGDVNNDGLDDFLIGAPGSLDGNSLVGSAGTGRAYLVYGDRDLSLRVQKAVDLENPLGDNKDLNILTFTNLALGSRTGASVAGVGDFIADGVPDIAIGAPDANLTGRLNQGAVYVVSGTAIRRERTETLALNRLGQTGSTGQPGYILVGDNAGDAAGMAVAGAGNVGNRTTAGRVPIDDLLIGAPDMNFEGVFSGPGSAYLIYGESIAVLDSYMVDSSGFLFIPLANVGATAPAAGVAVPGARFDGDLLGDDLTGYSVSTAGDFNADGFGDFLIGAPLWNSPSTGVDAGRAVMVYGRPASAPISGIYSLTAFVASDPSVEFRGEAPGAWAGTSVTAIGRINTDTINEIGIGSPGLDLQTGAAYIIPGNKCLFGSHSLSNTELLPIQGLAVYLTSTSGDDLLGWSISGNLRVSSQNRTIDLDVLGDVALGAAGLTIRNNLGNLLLGYGGSFQLQGTFLPVPEVIDTSITTTIGRIDASLSEPFRVSASTPLAMDIYVLSNATITPVFSPVTDINPATITVNGVPYPGATVVSAGDINGDLIPDAKVTITPRTLLNLNSSVTTLTVSGRTLVGSPFGVTCFTATARIRVSGGVIPPTGVGAVFFRAFFDPRAGIPRFGEQFLPDPTSMTKLTWGRLQPRVAYRQFVPNAAFAGRLSRFYHGNPYDDGHGHLDHLGSRNKYTQSGTSTLGRRVFTRGQFNQGLFDARTYLRKKD